MKIYKDLVAPTRYGKGTHITLDANQLAHAINSYIYAMGVVVLGPRTVTVWTKDGERDLCGGAQVYVDPSGRVLHNGDEVK